MGSVGNNVNNSKNDGLYQYNPDITTVTNDDIDKMIEYTDSLSEDSVAIPKGIGSSEHFIKAMERYFGGSDKTSGIAASDSWFTKEEQEFIRNSKTTTESPMYRLESASWMGNLRQGQEFQFGGRTGDIRSFSTNSIATVNAITDNVATQDYSNPVVFQTSGKVNYFNAMPYTLKTGSWEYTSQYEALVGGKWRVKSSDNIIVNGTKIKRYIIERA